jgi:hypothetical protein
MKEADIEEYLTRLEEGIKNYKSQLFRLCWYMRGGVTIHNLLFDLSLEDIQLMNTIVQDNIEITKKSGIALV